MSRLKVLLVLAIVELMPLVAYAGGRGQGGHSSNDSHDWGSTDSVDSISSAAGVPELNGGMLMLAFALTLAIVAIVRERRAAQGRAAQAIRD